MKNKQHQELAVCGFEAVKALAEKNPDRIRRLFFTQDRSRFFGPVCKTLAASRRLYRVVESPAELEKLSQSVHHQGVVAMIDEPDIPHLTSDIVSRWVEGNERVLVLDRVGNANNLGAIIRSAAFFGIQNIVIGEDDDQAQVSTSSYRVAQGGMEFVNLFRVSTAASLVLAMAGKMTRVGADHKAKKELSDLSALIASKGDRTPVLVVLGNEETGLAPEIRNACDHLVRIPGSGNVESLNVAQAATLFLYQLSIL